MIFSKRLELAKQVDDYIDNYKTNAGRKIIKNTFGVITVLDTLGFQLEKFFVKKPKFSQNETDKIFNTITAYGCREMTETRFHEAINEAIELLELYQKQSR
jgi:beta-xylosidase